LQVHWISVLSDFNNLNEWAHVFAIAIGFAFLESLKKSGRNAGGDPECKRRSFLVAARV